MVVSCCCVGKNAGTDVVGGATRDDGFVEFMLTTC